MKITAWVLLVIVTVMLSDVLSDAIAKDKTQPKALFRAKDVIDISIDSDFRTLVGKAKKSTDPYPATLTIGGETYEISINARGNSRRQRFCKFPPLKVRFTKDKAKRPPKGSLFRGQKSLKLVTHCENKKSFEQYLLLEYAAYNMLEKITPAHLKTRLARITYLNKGKQRTLRYGFFIEDIDHAAKRLGMKELKKTRVAKKQLHAEMASRAALFQYMVGNQDFSVRKTAKGAECCHNAKLIAADKQATTDIIPVLYDFDSTGLVDAPYAGPPARSKSKSLRQRFYRGYCLHNDATAAVIPDLIAQQDAVLAVLDEIEALDKSRRRTSNKFLQAFFKTISDPKLATKRLYKKCH